MIAVTGSTGHIGNCLIRELLKRKETVRAVVFPGEKTDSIEGLQIERFTADIRNKKEITEALLGADRVYHLAGLISIMPGMRKRVFETNVGGTENILHACIENHVDKIVYTGSIHAYTEPAGKAVIDENTPIEAENAKGTYGKSKAAATRIILDTKADLKKVVCCPSGVIGPYDYGISKMGSIILDFSRGKYEVCVDGSYDFVDVRDVASGLISAMENGRDGEIYNLGCEKIHIKRIMEILSGITGIKTPELFLPLKLLYPVSWVATAYYFLSGSQPILTPYTLHTLGTKYGFSYEKAKKELGYSPMKLEKSIEDSYKWFMEKGYLNKK